MTVRSMSSSQISRYTKFCEAQGIGVTRTKKGLFLRFPDGSSATEHFTTSDVKATQNMIARFRRAGVVHPEDTRPPKDLPEYITSGSISETTKQKIVDWVASRDYPEVVYGPDLVKELNMDPGWANRALYHSGFRPGPIGKNRKVARPWFTPQDILALKAPATPADVAQLDDGAKKAQAAVVEKVIASETWLDDVVDGAGFEHPITEALKEGRRQAENGEGHVATRREPPVTITTPEDAAEGIEPLTVQKDDEREFIDSHDSWVVDPKELFGVNFARFFDSELRTLKALGLEFEIRVWRKSDQ